MTQTQELEIFIPREKEGEYITLPFQMPENIATFHLTYHYQTHQDHPEETPFGTFVSIKAINTIDLGLLNPQGEQVGVSGSNKNEIFINAIEATPGYQPQELTPGEWKILIGAYKVAVEGVVVSYQLTFTPIERQLLIGDIHTHTIASDGVLSVEELATHAKRHSLDFLAITDHNQMVSVESLRGVKGITLIPGIEWTHYQGHANFLGVDKPYDEPFFTHSDEEVKARFDSARARGALIVINHPYEPSCGFQFNMTELPFDCLEIWNGPMRESNLKAVGLWQSFLESGKQIPAVGGSDYHKDGLFQILGGPCMGVYARANTPNEILDALRAGHSFIRFSPQGPTIQLKAGDCQMGDAQVWEAGQAIQIEASGLIPGDVIRVITHCEDVSLFQSSSEGMAELNFPVKSPGFVRVEILRTFLPGLPPLPALISNPIYFLEKSPDQ
ncbi:MAG TPA: CehA/McbA family metallohydrolase [Brevefilum sp.]